MVGQGIWASLNLVISKVTLLSLPPCQGVAVSSREGIPFGHHQGPGESRSSCSLIIVMNGGDKGSRCKPVPITDLACHVYVLSAMNITSLEQPWGSGIGLPPLQMRKARLQVTREKNRNKECLPSQQQSQRLRPVTPPPLTC